MNFVVLVNAAPFTQQGASTAYQFSKAALAKGHRITKIFFYQNGVHNANQLLVTPQGEIPLFTAWKQLSEQYAVELMVCVASAARRGILAKAEASFHGFSPNLAPEFKIGGLAQLLEAVLNSGRFISFN